MAAAIAAFLLYSFPVTAQETASAVSRHGIAMHGDPKYGPGFAHFDYVNPDAPKGGILRLHAIGSFDSLNPFIVKGIPASGLSYLGSDFIHESLMDQSNDEPFSMYGLLAESIVLPEDRSWVAFNLRPEAKWADGKPVTAEDVVWTFNTLLEKGSPFFKAYYGDVAKAQATSERRVLFTFAHNGNSELPLIISQMSVLPKHYWTAPGRDIGSTTLEPPMGSGPYKIGTVDAGRRIEYVRNENWWGKDLPINKGRYNFNRISYEYYRDGDVALEAFLAGEYDVREENTAKLWATAYDAPAVKDGRIIKQEIQHERPQGMQGFLYNIRRPVFADRAVREALAYA
ncbi:MAG: ABC transporter substrate-binding protein, partial [Proteobacteria bacterium]|nr:ABC transporter substrate-binding protein [Pseudomonadota bacterium]